MSDYEMKLMDLDVEQLGIPVSTVLAALSLLQRLLVANSALRLCALGAGVQLCGEDALWRVCPHLP